MPGIYAKSRGIEHAKRLPQTLGGITGAEAAAALGLDKRVSKLELWAEKTGKIQREKERKTEKDRLNLYLSSYMARRFAEETGMKVRLPEAVFAHDEFDFLTADHDWEIIGENGGEKAGLICKTANFAFEKVPENCEKLPKNWLAECYHNLAVMRFEKIYLAVQDLFSGIFKIYEIYYDEEKCRGITEAEARFWEDYVIAKIPPKPDGSESAEEVLKQLAKPSRGEAANLENYSESVRELYDLRQKIKEFESRERCLRQELIAAMDGNSSGIAGKFRVDFSKQDRKIADIKLLKEKHSEIYDSCLKDSAALVLKITEITG